MPIRIRYTIIFIHGIYVDIFSYQNDNYIYIVNQCSKGTHPERVTRKRDKSLTVDVHWCRMVYVKVKCEEFWMQRDYIPRNYEFLISFNKADLNLKSLMFHKNNVKVIIEKGYYNRGKWELPRLNHSISLEPKESTIDVNYFWMLMHLI